MTFSTSTGEALSILATKENEVVTYYVELSNKLDIYYKNSFHRE